MIIDLVDDMAYATTSNWQPYLTEQMKAFSNVTTVPLADIGKFPKPSAVISRLKQRTLFRNIDAIAKWSALCPFVIFDLDPWEAFYDTSKFKGGYAAFREKLNVSTFAVTSKWWVNYLNDRNYKSTFVKIWGVAHGDLKPFNERSTDIGFVGSMHHYRKKLFDELASLGISVNMPSGIVPYKEYCKRLADMKVYIRSDAGTLTIDGEPFPLTEGMFFRDVEIASLGCFSVRDRAQFISSYIDSSIKTVYQYDTPNDVPAILQAIFSMDPDERQLAIDSTVAYVNRMSLPTWRSTAETLVAHCQ